MDSLVSCIMCNLRMELFKQKDLAEYDNPLCQWKCSVDETYTVLPNGKDQSQHFTDYLNTMNEDMISSGRESWWKLKRMVWSQRWRRAWHTCTMSVLNKDGIIRTRVFRKETHMDQYLNFWRNHPFELKKGVVETLLHRAEPVVSNLEDKKEKACMKQALIIIRVNGYPEWRLNAKSEVTLWLSESVTAGETSEKPKTTHNKSKWWYHIYMRDIWNILGMRKVLMNCSANILQTN